MQRSLLILAFALPLPAAPSLTVNGMEANYTTTKFYLDELAAELGALTVVLDPDESSPITAAEVFSNLNNRDRANDDVIAEFTVTGNTGNFGDSVSATVTATSVAGITGPASLPSDPILLLDPAGDEDRDGQNNEFEDIAGTSPLDGSSRFETSLLDNQDGTATLSFPVAEGRSYRYQTSTDLLSWSDPVDAPATGIISLPTTGAKLFARILATKN